MELDITGPHREDAYRILSGLVTPRPIALTTTIDEHGRINAAPFSFSPLAFVAPSNHKVKPHAHQQRHRPPHQFLWTSLNEENQHVTRRSRKQ